MLVPVQVQHESIHQFVHGDWHVSCRAADLLLIPEFGKTLLDLLHGFGGRGKNLKLTGVHLHLKVELAGPRPQLMWLDCARAAAVLSFFAVLLNQIHPASVRKHICDFGFCHWDTVLLKQ